MKCGICGNSKGNSSYYVKEMKIGSGDNFKYMLCNECGTLQLSAPPDDMHKYYPANFDSFYSIEHGKPSLLKKIIFRIRNEHSFGKKVFLGETIAKFFPNYINSYLFDLNIRKESKILDIGSGSGKLLSSLFKEGLHNTLGIDPHIENDISHPGGLKILKGGLERASGMWDIILLNHSFEHESAPEELLSGIRNILSPKGICLIRTPVTDSWAFEHYRHHWVQIDAPRHYYIYSTDSLTLLAERCGFKVKKVIRDSTAFQFWGSEQYMKDITLLSERSLSMGPAGSIFSRKEIRAFEKRARRMNILGIGDQAAFYLRPHV